MPGPIDLARVTSQEILKEIQRRVRCADKKPRRAIFIGPPGAGKGTQAPLMQQELCLCHLSTEHMIRTAVQAGTEMGKRAKSIVNSGQVLGDDVIAEIIRDAVRQPGCEKGFILDGFPQTDNQARLLDDILAEEDTQIDKVIDLNVDDELLIKRITGRMIHEPSGRIYNVYFNPPKVAGKDDVTGETLEHRSDDTEENFLTRLEVFHSQTKSVVEYYSAHGKVTHIDASQDMKHVSEDIRRALTDDSP